MLDPDSSDREGPRGPILPMLVPADWERRDTHIARPLLSQVPLPVPLEALVLVYGAPAQGEVRRRFVTQEDLDAHGGTRQQLLDRARENLAARPFEWRLAGPHVVTLEHDDFAAEQACNPVALAAAAKRLGTRGPLAISIPRRTKIFVTPIDFGSWDPWDAQTFVMAGVSSYTAAGPERICPHLLGTDDDYRVDQVIAASFSLARITA